MSGNRGQGRITRGLAPDTAVRKTLDFVAAQLPDWRDDPDRPEVEAEEELNGQLCKHLNVAARHEDFSMAYFHHEERQTARHRVDLSALPPGPTVIEGRAYTIYEPFLVLEGKRLPAPSKDREREYVTGGNKTTGGIQRFKLGLHGAILSHAGIIAYIQKDSSTDWFVRLNDWITELAAEPGEWTDSEVLQELATNQNDGSSRCCSIHHRIEGNTNQIRLTHLWVEMH